VLVLAGCSAAPGTPGGTDVTPADTLTDEPTDSPGTPEDPVTVTETPEGPYNAFTFRAYEITPEAIAREQAAGAGDLHEERARLYRSMFEDGNATRLLLTDADEPLGRTTFEQGAFLRNDGVYYRADRTVLDRWTGEGYLFEFKGPLQEYHDDYQSAQDRAVPYGDLSPAQRDLFDYIAPRAPDRRNGSLSASVTYLPPAGSSLGKAWLDGRPHYVRKDSELFRLQYEDKRPETVRLRVRYTPERVADSASAFIDGRLARLVTNVTAEQPTDPAREVIVSTVVEGEFEWEGTVRTRPARVEAAERWVREHPPEGSHAYVRYDGELYLLEVQEVIE
jgi:hypothetical protein